MSWSYWYDIDECLEKHILEVKCWYQCRSLFIVGFNHLPIHGMFVAKGLGTRIIDVMLLGNPIQTVNRDLKQTLEAARWTSTGSKISRSRANYHNHVEFCPRPPTVVAVRKVGFTALRDGHFIFRFVARRIHGNSSI